jgi:hypothetical protein
MARINMKGLKAEIAQKGYKIVKPAVEARVKRELDKSKRLRKKPNELSFILRFSVPTKEEIAAVSPGAWSTESWVDAVEKGMSGLGRYLYSNDASRFSTSRSRGGIESKFDVRQGQTSKPIDYMSGILVRMLKNIESNLKRL